MSALLDLWHSVLGIVTGGDHISLAILVVVALAAGYMTENLASILNSTVLALVGFSVVTLVYEIVVAKGKGVGTIAQTGWGHLQTVTIHTLLAYAITAAVLIVVGHVIRTVIQR